MRHALRPLRALRERVAAWRYEASPDARGTRDLRVDLLRGFCVVVMIVDHVGGESSRLYAITGGNRFVVSAAEGFVLLSGISMGLVHRRVVARDGVRAMFRKVLDRSWLLYALTVVLTIVFAAFSSALGTPWSSTAAPASSGGEFALSVALFQRSYSLSDVLLLYTLLVLAAGPALWLIARGGTAVALALSWAVWAAAQLWPGRAPEVWPILDGGFPLVTWQAIFVSGLALGWHRERIARWLAPARLAAVGGAAAVALVALQAVASRIVPPGELEQLLFDKDDVRVGRVLALTAAAAFGWVLATVAWVPVRRVTGGLLLRLGQRALVAYAAQLFVVAFWWSSAVGPLRLDRWNEAAQIAAVAMVWTAVTAWPRLTAWANALTPRATLAPARWAAGTALVVPLALAVSGASLTPIGTDLLATRAVPLVATAVDAAMTASDGVRYLSPSRGETGTYWGQHQRRRMWSQ